MARCDATAPALADTAGGIYCSGGHIDICTAGILPAGASFDVSFHLQAGGPGLYTFAADVSGLRLDPIRGDTSSSTSIVVSRRLFTRRRQEPGGVGARFA